MRRTGRAEHAIGQATRVARNRALISAGAGMLLLLSACGLMGARRADQWLSPVARTHPLVGQIWDVARGRAIECQRLLDHLARADYVLLGEKHDNADHHRLQARVVESLVARGRRPVVAFEMIAADRSAAVAEVLSGASPTVAAVRQAIGEEDDGWDWDIYVPILEAALAGRLPIVPADLPPVSVEAIRAQGLDSDLATPLALDRVPFSRDDQEALADEIRESHCHMAPEAMVERLVDVQRARDAHLARSLAEAAESESDGGVLIAGVGHVRRDWGVPLYLASWNPDRTVVGVAFLEVAADLTDPGSALAARFGEAVPVDYVWFTPRVDEMDPCDKYREQLEQMGSRGS